MTDTPPQTYHMPLLDADNKIAYQYLPQQLLDQIAAIQAAITALQNG